MSNVETETRAEAAVDALGLLYRDGLDPDDFVLFPRERDEAVSIAITDEGVDRPQGDYGGQDAFECLVRTVLSQNTSDEASQPAFDALIDRYGGGEGRSARGNGRSYGPGEAARPPPSPTSSAVRGASDASMSPSPGRQADLAAALAGADRSELADTIRPAGLYNRKSGTLVGLAKTVVAEFGGEDAFDEFVRETDPETVRTRLLEMRGVGPKTADCVLLFSGGREGIFPVDTHVHRIARRIGLAPPDADHEAVRERLESDVPPANCGFGHTAMVQFGREYCSARKPACLDGPEACPLSDLCDRIGVNSEAGEVVDPADADSEN